MNNDSNNNEQKRIGITFEQFTNMIINYNEYDNIGLFSFDNEFSNKHIKYYICTLYWHTNLQIDL